jgi:putative ABC transport system permease protein
MLKVTLRGIRTHLLRFVSTLLAVLLGVGFMCGTLVLGDTVKKGFDGAFADIYANIDVVVRSTDKVSTPFGGDQRAQVDDAIIPTLTGLPGIAAAEGQVQKATVVVAPDGDPLGPTGGAPTFVMNWMGSPQLNAWIVVDGAAPSAPDQAVIDKATATNRKVGVGDTIQVTASSGVVPFTVSGIATFGEIDSYGGSTAVLIPTEQAQIIGAEPGKFDWINLAAADGVSQDEARAEVAKVLPPNTEALTGKAFTEEQQDLFRQLISILTNFITAFGVIALFVGAFIIYNTFTIIVTQRTQELALLRALGAGRRQIVGSVFLEALVVGIVASLLGIGFGIVLAIGLNQLLGAIGLSFATQNLVIQPTRFITPVLLALVVTLASAIFPAIRASRVAPIAAMRDIAIDQSSSSRLRMVLGAVFTALAGLLVYLGFSGSTDNALLLVGVGMLGVFLGAATLGPVYGKPLSRVLGSPLARLYGVTGRLAKENTLRNPSRTATTAAALIISVGLVSLITIAGSSIKATQSEVLDKSFKGDFIVSTTDFTGMSPAVAEQIRQDPGVETTASLRFGFAQVGEQNPEGTNNGSVLLATNFTDLNTVFDVGVVEGSTELGATGMAVLQDWANDNNKAVGDVVPVRFITADGPQDFTISAIYKTDIGVGGGGYLISTEAFDANVPESQRVDQNTFVKLAPGADPAAVKERLDKIIEPFPTVQLQDLTEFKEAQNAQIDQSLAFVYAMLGLAVLIGLIGIVNTLLLSVFERTREIGLMRAVGMTRAQVRRTIRLESVIIALIGTITGLIIGVFFAWALVKALSTNQSQELVLSFPYNQLVIIVLIASVFGVLAALWPARRASRLNVLQAIATE